MSGFGECISCGNPVERVAWDDECFSCQDAWEDEVAEDDESRGQVWEEYQALYTVGIDAQGNLLT